MADKKLSELTELAAAPASDDEVYIRDVSEEAAAESKRITIANLLAGIDAATLGGFKASELASRLTEAIFQSRAATGTMTNPQNLNDNDTGTLAIGDAVDEYAEVDFGTVLQIKQYRHYGNYQNNGNGKFKLQYWDGAAWQDWETDITTDAIGMWSDWISPAAGVKAALKVRAVVTLLDTSGANRIAELEIRY